MVLATLLLICAVPQADEPAKVGSAKTTVERPAVSAAVTDSVRRDATASPELPSAPQPKVNVEPAAVSLAAQPFVPVRPVTRPVETPGQRKMWYGLMAVGHAGAAFDAWSTHRAVAGGYGQEANPFLKPFASSNAIYAATQVSPAFMDFLGKRMMTSQNLWVRKLWWVPQLAGASVSFVAGAHNVGVVH